MNNVSLIGRLTKDTELSYTPQQTAVCKFQIAINRGKDKNGNDMGADYIRITVWGKMAENCDKYLFKGKQVGITGRIQTGSYEDRNGTKHYTTEVIASNVEFLGGGESKPQEEAPAEYDNFAAADTDIPF